MKPGDATSRRNLADYLDECREEGLFNPPMTPENMKLASDSLRSEIAPKFNERGCDEAWDAVVEALHKVHGGNSWLKQDGTGAQCAVRAIEKLAGHWEKAEERCPQCGTGVTFARSATAEHEDIFHPHCKRCQKPAPSSGGCADEHCGIRENGELEKWKRWAEYACRRFKEETGKDLQAEAGNG